MSDLHPGEAPHEYKEPVFPPDIGTGGEVDLDIVRGGADMRGPGGYDLDTPIVSSRGQRGGYSFPNGNETSESQAQAPADTAPTETTPAAEPVRVEYGHGDDFDRVSEEVAAQADREPEREDWAAPVPVIPERVKEAAGTVVESVAHGVENVFGDEDIPLSRTRNFLPGDTVKITMSGTELKAAPEQNVDMVYPPQRSSEADVDVIFDEPAGSVEAEVTAEIPVAPADIVTDQNPPQDSTGEVVADTTEPNGPRTPEAPAGQVSEQETPEAVAPGPGPVETEPEIDAVPIETSEPAQAEAEPVTAETDTGQDVQPETETAPQTAEQSAPEEVAEATPVELTETAEPGEPGEPDSPEAEPVAALPADEIDEAAADASDAVAAEPIEVTADEAEQAAEPVDAEVVEASEMDDEVIDPEIVGDQLKRDEEPVDAEIISEEGPNVGQEVVPSEGKTETAAAEELQPDGTWATEDGTHEGMTQEEWDAEMAAIEEEARQAAAEAKAAYDAAQAEAAEARARARAERLRTNPDNIAFNDFMDRLDEIFANMRAQEAETPEPEAAAAEQDAPPHYEDPLQQPDTQEAQQVPPPPQEAPQPPAEAETPPDVPSPDDTPQQPEPKTDTPPPVGERGYPEGDLRNNILPPPGKAKQFVNSFGYYGKKGAKTLGALVGSTIASAIFGLFQNMEVVGTPTPSAEGGFDVTVRRGNQTSRVNVKANSAEEAKAQFKRGTGNFAARFRAAFKVN